MITEDVKAWHSKLCDMSTEDIVTLMEQEQIKATPSHNRGCAISLLIKKKTGEPVSTGWGGMLGVRENGILDLKGPMLTNSQSVRDFVSAFDKNRYPQLVK